MGTPTGCLPYAEMPDGKVIVESGAIGRAIAGAGGFLGEGGDYIISEMLAGMTVDLTKKVLAISPTVISVADFGADKKKAFEVGKPDCLESITKFQRFLLPAGDRFTEMGTTFGEVDLFCKLDVFAKGALPDVATGPLKAFYDRMKEVPGIKKVLDGESKMGPLTNYLVPI